MRDAIIIDWIQREQRNDKNKGDSARLPLYAPVYEESAQEPVAESEESPRGVTIIQYGDQE